MCCLGQFAIQLGHSRDEIFEANTPSEILYKKEEGTLIYGQRGRLTQFARSAMHINDDYHDESDKPLTPQNRIAKLRELCKEYGYNLEIENEHLLEEYDE